MIPALLSSCYSTLGRGLRDEGLSDWVSAHQPERQAFFSLHRLGSPIFSFSFPIKCWPSPHFLLSFNDLSPCWIFSPHVSLCTSTVQCLSPLAQVLCPALGWHLHLSMSITGFKTQQASTHRLPLNKE